jgi:hypothetical protein
MTLITHYTENGHTPCDLSAERGTLRIARPITTRTSPHTPSAGRSRIFVTDAIMNGLPPHIAQVICGHKTIDTTIGYKNSQELHQTGAKLQVAC